MGRYWDGDGRHQKELEALAFALVPEEGDCETLEGEMISAANRIHYEFFNNGGGNNVSGALAFLAKHLPDFRETWTEALAPFVTGQCEPVDDECEAVLDATEQVLDAVVDHVIDRAGRYRPLPESFRSLDVRRTGAEYADRVEGAGSRSFF
jgi:hypothetical protein